MNELISVIIPVYRVESYLSACVESVLRQTYQYFEIILVDDGSPDKCGDICDKFAAQDSRVRVIHKKNGGLSSARNAGIDIARGAFIAFLDSDDLWSSLFLERLYQAVRETDADFSVCLFDRFQEKPKEKHVDIAQTKCLSQQEAFRCLFDNRNVNMVVAWNKLYRAELFKKIRYPVGMVHEDEAIIHEIIGAAQRVAWVEESHYFYRESPNSITTAKFSLKRLDETYAKEQRIIYFEKRGMQDLADRTKIVYLGNLMRLYRTVQAELVDNEVIVCTCAKLFEKFCAVYNSGLVRKCSLATKMRCWLFLNFPEKYSRFEYKRLQRKGNT